jgi:peptide/nickel transport system substrate-binding protein
MSDRCNSLYQQGFTERYAKVEALGAKRVRFHLKQPLATFRTDIDFGIISFHGLPPHTCRVAHVIGAGPYVVRELTSRHVLLDRNPYYFGTPAKLPHVEIKFVPDDSARLLMLVGGSIDLLQNASRPDLVGDIAARPRVRVATSPSVLLTYMLINNDDAVLRDLRVREANALAIDRKAIVAAKYGGRAELATGLLPAQNWAYDGDVPRWSYDPARARRLLDEAGHPPDASGVRLHLVYKTSANAFRLDLARLIARQLGRVGIAVEVRSFEFATFFADVKQGNYQIATMQSPPLTEPDFFRWFFHSSNIPDAEHKDRSNRWRYRSPEVDRLSDAGRRELDPARRKAIYAELQRLTATDLPIIPLWHEDNVVLSNVDVQGYVATPNAGFDGLVSTTKRP